jgi:hypothetical protein
MAIGPLVAGPLWQLQCCTSYGIRECRLMLDRYATIPKLRRNFGYWPALSIAEARIQHRDMHSRLERLMSIKDIHR